MNDAFSELTGQRENDLRGMDCREVEAVHSLWNVFTACLLHGREQSEQLAFRDKTLLATLTPIQEDGQTRLVSITLKDISSFVSLQTEFLKRNKELVITNTLSSAFISSSDMEHVYHDLLEKVLIISDLGMGWIVSRLDDEFVLRSAGGVSREFKEKIEGGGLDFLFKTAAESKDPLYVLESERDEMPELISREGIVFFCSIPLRVGEETIGLLMLASRVAVGFDFDLASLLSLVGNNLSLIAEKIMLFQKTERLAVTDALTGLYNARYFYDMLNAEVARTERYSTPFSLVLFDIDDFKILNDTYGHQAGDEVLRAVAQVLHSASRKTDIVARYGGEEFISILPNSSKEMAYNLACRVKEAVESTRFLGDDSVRISLSGGVATFPFDASDAKSLLYAADMAMYEAKAAGKKQIRGYSGKEE